MKLLILLLSLISSAAIAQCDRRYAASASIEFTSAPGFIIQGGITGQQSMFSFHAGVKVARMPYGEKLETSTPTALPRLELMIRLFGTDRVGIHAFGSVSKLPDAGLLLNYQVGEKVGIKTRLGYDQKPFAGAGLHFFF